MGANVPHHQLARGLAGLFPAAVLLLDVGDVVQPARWLPRFRFPRGRPTRECSDSDLDPHRLSPPVARCLATAVDPRSRASLLRLGYARSARLHQFFGWIFNIRKNRDNIDANRYRPLFQLKYYILVVFFILAAFGALQIGLLDPIVMLTRATAINLQPAIDATLPLSLQDFSSAPGAAHQRIFSGAWFAGLLVLGLIAMNMVIPRFFCRVLCPRSARSWACSLASRSGASTVTLRNVQTATCVSRAAKALRLHRRRCARASASSASTASTTAPKMRSRLLARLCRSKDRISGSKVRSRRARRRFSARNGHLQERRHRDQGARRAATALDTRGHWRRARLSIPSLFGNAVNERGFNGKSDSPPGHGRGARVSRALHQVRPVHQRLPDQRAATLDASGGWTRRLVDTGHGLRGRRMPAQLHAL